MASPGAISRTSSGKPGFAQPLPERGDETLEQGGDADGPMSTSGALRPGRSPYFHANTSVAKSATWSR
jgi:hypothetical protein